MTGTMTDMKAEVMMAGVVVMVTEDLMIEGLPQEAASLKIPGQSTNEAFLVAEKALMKLTLNMRRTDTGHRLPERSLVHIATAVGQVFSPWTLTIIRKRRTLHQTCTLRQSLSPSDIDVAVGLGKGRDPRKNESAAGP